MISNFNLNENNNIIKNKRRKSVFLMKSKLNFNRKNKKSSTKNLIHKISIIDIEIKRISKIIKTEIENKKNLNQIILNKNENIEELVFYALLKYKNNNEEKILISYYISNNFPKLIDLINKSKINFSLNDIFYLISSNLHREDYKKNYILFRYGDYGNEFYLILKGKINIIVKNDYFIEMNYYEYFKYIEFLYKIKEYEIINYILEMNKFIFNKNEIEKYLKLNENNNNLEFDNIFNEFEYKIEYPKIKNLDYLSIDEYLSIVNPILLNKNIDNSNYLTTKKLVTIIKYFHLNDLNKGETFGENIKGEFKRNFTAICAEDNTILTSLSNKIYNKCLKEVQFKERKKVIEKILKTEFFQYYNLEYFDKKIFPFFKLICLNQGQFLFKQNEIRKEIYFLKEGEIEIFSDLNFYEMCEIIKIKNFKSPKFNKLLDKNFYNSKKNFQLLKISNSEFLGLDDFIKTNEEYFCSLKILSNKAEIYSMDFKIFENFLKIDEKIFNQYKIYSEKKNKVIIERLLIINNMNIENEIKKLNRNKKIFNMENIIFNKPKEKNIFPLSNNYKKQFNLNSESNFNQSKNSFSTRINLNTTKNSLKKNINKFINNSINNNNNISNNSNFNNLETININRNNSNINIFNPKKIKKKNIFNLLNKTEFNNSKTNIFNNNNNNFSNYSNYIKNISISNNSKNNKLIKYNSYKNTKNFTNINNENSLNNNFNSFNNNNEKLKLKNNKIPIKIKLNKSQIFINNNVIKYNNIKNRIYQGVKKNVLNKNEKNLFESFIHNIYKNEKILKKNFTVKNIIDPLIIDNVLNDNENNINFNKIKKRKNRFKINYKLHYRLNNFSNCKNKIDKNNSINNQNYSIN